MSSAVSHQNGSAALRPRAVPETKKVDDLLSPQLDRADTESRWVFTCDYRIDRRVLEQPHELTSVFAVAAQPLSPKMHPRPRVPYGQLGNKPELATGSSILLIMSPAYRTSTREVTIITSVAFSRSSGLVCSSWWLQPCCATLRIPVTLCE